MKRICPTVIDCVCDETGLLNLSSEDPDPLIFTGIGYTPAVTFRPPTLGPNDSFALAQDCYGVAYSVASQEIADMIAEINAQYCQNQGEGVGGTPVDLTPIIPTGGTTPGRRITKRGGGGGGGGGGEKRTQAPRPGGGGVCMTKLNPWGCADDELDPTEYVYMLTTSRAGSDYLFSTGGSLPPGVTLTKMSANAASLRGTPDFDAHGSYDFTITVELAGTEPGNRFIVCQLSDTFDVLGLTNAADAPVIDRNIPYSFQLQAFGTAPITFTQIGGEMPAGISVDANGLISGTATNADCGKEFLPEIQMTDADGRTCWDYVPLQVSGLEFTNGEPDPATLCANYSFQFTAEPVGAVFTAVTIPCGMTLDPDGLLHGIPQTTNGTVSIHAEIPGQPECSGDEDYLIDIAAGGTCSVNYPPLYTQDRTYAVEDIVWIQTGGGGTISGSAGTWLFKAIGGFTDMGCSCTTASSAVQGLSWVSNQCSADYDIDVVITPQISDSPCTYDNCVPPYIPPTVTLHISGILRFYSGGVLVYEEIWYITGTHAITSGSRTFTIHLPPGVPGLCNRLQASVTCNGASYMGMLISMTPLRPPSC